MSLADTAGGGLWSAFTGGQQQAQQQGTANLQSIGMVQGILAKQQAIQRETQLRGVLSSLPPTATSDDVMRAIRPFATADELMKSGDRRLNADSNKEMALARLQQAAAQSNQMMQFRLSQAKTAQERAQIEAEHKQFNDKVNAERLKYDTGAIVAPPSYAPPPPPAALSGSAPDQASGIAAINANVAAGGPGGTLQIPTVSTPAAPVAAPVAPQPAQAPTSPIDAGIIQMPPSVAALPKKMQDKWLSDNSGGGIENTAKGIANYEIAPLSSFAMARPLGAQIMGRVKEINPNFDAKNYQLRVQGESNFQNTNGPLVRGFNVLLNHLDTAQELYTALNNGDVQTVNRAKNAFQKEFGQPAPVNADAAKQFLAAEAVKAVSGAKGALGDRQTMEQSFSTRQSPEQFLGTIDTIKKLAVGQLQGHEQQYKSVTAGKTDFQDRFLTDKSRAMFAKYAGASGGNSIPEFATEAAAQAANLKSGTKVKIGGVVGTWH